MSSEASLSTKELRQIRRLRFDQPLEADFQFHLGEERIGRIRTVIICVIAAWIVLPSPKETTATPVLQAVLAATLILTLAMAILVFLPWFKPFAIYALPLWDVFQQVGFGWNIPNPDPPMQTTIQLAFSIVIVSATRLPFLISLCFAVVTALIKGLIWNKAGLPLDAWLVPGSEMVFGLSFLVIGAYLTERADRRTFLISKLLEGERSRTQALLANVLPSQIAQRLQNTNEVIASHHSSVTVLFADVKDFTVFPSQRTPAEVVGFLNDLFSRFDALVEASGLEKIKTVGDAYMVAGGAPDERPDHCKAMADLALELRGAASAMGAQVRFGLAEGPVVAGVIGSSKYMYDLWGSTVNLAARLQTHASAGQILVSESVCQAVSETHDLEELGEVELKGIGAIKAFVLQKRKVRPVNVS